MSIKAIANINAAMQSTLGGFTIEAESGNAFLPTAGTEAWLVGGLTESLVIKGDGSDCSFEALVKWYSAAKEITTNPIVGGWEYEGEFHLDLVAVIHDEESALWLGREWGEIAIGKLDHTGAFTELVLN